MRAAGLVEVERAKADGRWDTAYRQKDAPIPDDLQVALDANPGAAAFFAKLTAQNRFAILFRIGSVKRAKTRAARKRRDFASAEDEALTACLGNIEQTFVDKLLGESAFSRAVK